MYEWLGVDLVQLNREMRLTWLTIVTVSQVMSIQKE